ncbi:uncharacterized protein LOC110858061 isoform X2 [Folsomia candida]|nr:uncharacterized protein LOC110858061 isoform X2 [Folsomia candida]
MDNIDFGLFFLDSPSPPTSSSDSDDGTSSPRHSTDIGSCVSRTEDIVFDVVPMHATNTASPVEDLLRCMYEMQGHSPVLPVHPQNLQRPGTLNFCTAPFYPDSPTSDYGGSSSDGSLTPESPILEEGHKCHICHKVLKHLQSLKRHWKRHQEGNTKYVCRICLKPLSTQASRVRHENSHKGREEEDVSENGHRGFRQACPTCEKMFWDRTLFER